MSSTAPKILLFDWDGTLDNSLPIWCQLYQEILPEFGLHLPVTTIARELIPTMAKVMEYGLSRKQLEQLAEKMFLGAQTALLEKGQLQPGAREFLHSAKARGYTLAIVSSTRGLFLRQVMQQRQVTEFFSTIIAREDVTQHKPHPEPFLLALTRLNISSEQAIVIGDSHADMEGAKAANIPNRVLFFPTHHQAYYQLSEQDASATQHIADLADLSL